MKTRVLLTGLTIAVLVTACGGSPSTTSTDALNFGTGDAGKQSPSTAPAGKAPAQPTAPATDCPPAGGTEARTTKFKLAPAMCIDVTKTYTAKVDTSAGSFTIRLDPASAPLAVNNFVVLARNHFYDGVSFHRIIPGFVIQGGDAVGQPAGTGDPGYSFADELPASGDVYQPGTLAMANSGPDTNGSQFFVVLATDRLQPKYSVFGQVTEGFDTTVQKIAKTGTAGGTPSSPTTMTSVTITES